MIETRWCCNCTALTETNSKQRSIPVEQGTQVITEKYCKECGMKLDITSEVIA